MSNTAQRIKNKYEANKAVNLMIADMETLWEGFQCDGKIIPDSQGAWVKISIPMEDDPEAWTAARLLRNGDEYVCIADFYIGEGVEVVGSKGNMYIVTEMEELVAA